MSKTKKVYSLYLPSLLSVNELNTTLTGKPGTSKITTGALHIYTILMKHIVEQRKKKDVEITYCTGYTQIPHEVLESYLGANYLTAIDLLIKDKYLEMLMVDEDGVYYEKGYYKFYHTKGGRCKAYRIPTSLYTENHLYIKREHKPNQHDMNKKDAVNRKNIEYQEKYRNMVLTNMRDIVIQDTPESRYVLEVIFSKRGVRLTPEEFIDIFNNSPFRTEHIDSYGYRCFCPITSLEKITRKFQRFSDDIDEPLEVLDFVASQPALIANMNSSLIKKLIPECSDAIKYFKQYENDEKYLKYKRLATSGLIYEYFVEKFAETF
ncbi:MAG: hypothetical protein EOP45_07740 [Sphingobacteriaceae bacterium]|nr:MAG: hypothetical protein EOP45_07740 [Sphingobacteriaceae bacterium]